MDENVKVAVRCRPLSRKEVDRGCSSIVDIVGKSIKVRGSDSRQEEKTFTFDYVYGVDSIQQTVYHELGRPVVTQALDGFNGTIFAYGQTGSGKTHSMMGNDENPGIIPQLNDDLWVLVAEKFQQIDQNAKNDRSKTQYLITVSFLEVYNEEVKDLLNPSDKKLNIRESPTQGIFVEGLAELVRTTLLLLLKMRSNF
jgi:kinesin family protein 1/kinesin family protein 3/17